LVLALAFVLDRTLSLRTMVMRALAYVVVFGSIGALIAAMTSVVGAIAVIGCGITTGLLLAATGREIA
jgi:hypothetical protein